jgi:hypothetical protein
MQWLAAPDHVLIIVISAVLPERINATLAFLQVKPTAAYHGPSRLYAIINA